MAEEGTLGMVRAQDTGDDFSKAELQRRMDEARESITQTVTEIKDNVVQQYETVKETISETLDWREQVKKRPVAWVAGAAGVGFLTGYAITSMVKGEDYGRYADYKEQLGYDYPPATPRAYAAQSAAESGSSQSEADNGPGFLERIQETPAFDRIKTEAATIGNDLVSEVSKTAKELLVPAAVAFVQNWLGGILPKKSGTTYN